MTDRIASALERIATSLEQMSSVETNYAESQTSFTAILQNALQEQKVQNERFIDLKLREMLAKSKTEGVS